MKRYVCPVCGYVHEGNEPPEKCPQCGVPGSKFKEEAVQAVGYFLDDAVVCNVHRLRILHGTGNGILRTLVRQYLSTMPFVKHFHDEHVQFGGAGITVVELL